MKFSRVCFPYTVLLYLIWGNMARGILILFSPFCLRRPTFPSSWKSGQKSHSRGGGSPLLPLKIPSCDQGGGLRPPSLDSPPPTGGTHPWGIPKGAAAPIGRLGWGFGGRGVRNPLPPAALLPTFAAVGKSRSPKANVEMQRAAGRRGGGRRPTGGIVAVACSGAAGWGHPALRNYHRTRKKGFLLNPLGWFPSGGGLCRGRGV